ncbi:hypothetical protein ABK046_45955, partial [Streptomyces caeruleatus]
ADELRSSDSQDYNGNTLQTRLSNVDNKSATDLVYESSGDSDDDAMAEGWLRIEYILADKDGDGVAERLCVYRLREKILKCEVTSHVPIATSS